MYKIEVLQILQKTSSGINSATQNYKYRKANLSSMNENPTLALMVKCTGN